MQEGEVESRKARRLRDKVAVAYGPLPKRALQPIDPRSLAFEQANALVEVADAGKMRVEAPKIGGDGGVHRDGAGGRGQAAIRLMAALADGGPELTMFFYHVKSKDVFKHRMVNGEV